MSTREAELDTPWTLLRGDCLDRLRDVPDRSVDLVACDLPYGTTRCEWDKAIPLGPLWDHYRRVIRPRGSIVLTACQPFTTTLINSNPRWFRYDDVWDKVAISGHLDARRRPLRRHESILLFSRGGSRTYNPQMSEGEPYIRSAGRVSSQVYDGFGRQRRSDNGGTRYPTSVVRISNADRTERLLPTQKPVALMEYIINTYSNPGDVVLDNAMGSGTTGVAAIRLGRRFLGIEVDPITFDAAAKRINAARLTDPSGARGCDRPATLPAGGRGHAAGRSAARRIS